MKEFERRRSVNGIGKVGSASSLSAGRETETILNPEWLSDDFCSSEELDKLSMCLSEASSSENNGGRQRQSLLADIVQAQLALWTLIITIFYSYAWQNHRKKFLLSVFVVLPTAMVVCCTLSSMLTVIVILGRFFSSPVRFQDILHVDGGNDDNDGSVSTTGGGNGGGGGIRRRTTSVSSCHSCGGSSIKGFTFSCDELPKPMCRKHSAEGSSLSLFGSNGNGSGIVRSDSIGGYSARPRLTHQYSHSPADGSGTSAVVDR
uniref:Transmembrane protein n=1 Tax=Meloidogyne incognita TaxID=6306 RepID=A0A914N4I1_MELIC